MAPTHQLYNYALVVGLFSPLVSAYVSANDAPDIRESLFLPKNCTGIESDKGQVIECGAHRSRESSPNNRNAGAYAANEGEYPSVVRVRAFFDEQFIDCGGTIISERLVITAAHCLVYEQLTLTSVEIFAGNIGASGGLVSSGAVFEAQQFCLPEGFNVTEVIHGAFDVAVLITRRAIRFTELIQPACLPALDIDSSYQAYVVGWGYFHEYPDWEFPNNNMQVLPVERHYKCSRRKRPQTICFISNDPKYVGIPCIGDSGGPAYAIIDGRQSIVGIASHGTPNCTVRSSIFMNVFNSKHRVDEMVKACGRL